MKRGCIATLAFVCLFVCSCGVQRKSLSVPAYDVVMYECIQITGDNNCIVSVSATGKDVQTASMNAIRNSVYEMIYNGIPGSAANRIKDLPALVPDKETLSKRSDYFTSFFSKREYLSFAEIIPESVPKIIKTSTGYKVNVTVLVKKNELRKKLEKDGLITSLSNIL